MDKSIFVRCDQWGGLHRSILGVCTLLWLLPATWAQQAVSTGQAAQIAQPAAAQQEDDGAKLAQEWRALCEQMRAQKLSPQQQISKMEDWQNANRARLEAQKSNSKASLVSQQLSNADPVVRSAAKETQNLTGDELALANLEDEIRQAVQELNARDISPQERIGAMDAFLKNNKDAFQTAQTLRKKIQAASAAKSEASTRSSLVNLSQNQALSSASQTLLTQRDTILNEINTKLDAADQLSPVERIAAIDRDKAFIEERTAALRQIDQLIQSSNK